MENKYFMVDGKEYSVIFTAENRESGKKYIAYTDGSFNEQGRTRMFFSAYTENENGISLIPASTDEQQTVIQNALVAYLLDDEWDPFDSL